MYFPALAKKTISTHSPIHLASRNGHYDIVKALIDKGMSPNLEVTSFCSSFFASTVDIFFDLPQGDYRHCLFIILFRPVSNIRRTIDEFNCTN